MMSNSMSRFMAVTLPGAPSGCATHYWRECVEMQWADLHRDFAAIRTCAGSPTELRDRYKLKGALSSSQRQI